MIALTGYDDKLRWQIATENMKVNFIAAKATYQNYGET
jgi:hypothetical protein